MATEPVKDTESDVPKTMPALPKAFATECDLVMKGGITSGIVYPLAIVEIAKAFRLRSIGGTSAGAIAAAAAAAAELGRQRFESGALSEDPGGFETLGQLPEHLCKPAADGRGTKLLAFFKPAPGLRPVFNTLTAVLGANGKLAQAKAALSTLIGHYKGAALLGLVVGTLPLWAPSVRVGGLLVWLWILVVGAACALGAVLWTAASRLVRELPANRFGICSGMPGTDDVAPDEALTVWLADFFDRLCGQRQVFAGGAQDVDQRKPLTFGDLKGQGIDLQVMTTCLTMGRPFRLPFGDDEHVKENRQFLYKESEFRRLFPASVVDWMVARERAYEGGTSKRFAQVDFQGFRSLPDPEDLPVVVAVRMSLSFPVLLSAIPLYAIDFRRAPYAGEKPECCWFTDGGVGSNFPIHFFDGPLPTRPTFGLDLGQTDDPDSPRVRFPRTNGDARLAYWRRFAAGEGLGAIAGFLGSVVNVAKDWNHEALSHLPGFRDRIGLIQLTDEEGGLNLTMPKDRIQRLTGFGREAGKEFVRRFGDPAKWPAGMQASPMDWENHQLIRLRLILASMTELVEGLERASTKTAGTQQDYARFFAKGYGSTTYQFKGLQDLTVDVATGLYKTQAGLARSMLDDLVGLARRVAATVAASPPSPGVHPALGAPKPTPELKLRPRI